MTDVVGTLTTELRISGRIVRETLLGLKRTGWMNIVIVITMASILSIFGVVIAVMIQLGTLIQTIGSELQIMAYIRNDAPTSQVTELVQHMPHVQKILLIPKEKAWQDMQRDYPFTDIANPLPDTIHIQMTSEQFIPATVEKLKAISQIEYVQYPKAILTKVRHIAQATSFAGIVVSVVLGLLTFFIISNTIHLLIQAKRREIEILRMMGVGNWYIRIPFLCQGGLYGLAGALVAYIPLSFAVYYLIIFFNYLGFVTSDTITSYVFMIFILPTGLLVGSCGAAMAMRKYLHV